MTRTARSSRRPELLITTAITAEGIAEQANFLIELARRRDGRKTAFIACENDSGVAFPALEWELRLLGVSVRRTVVNRVCSDRETNGSNGGRRVKADAHAEWFIEGEPDCEVLRALDRIPYVEFVADIEPNELRKRWLVNGAHLAIALLAEELKQQTINGAATALERLG